MNTAIVTNEHGFVQCAKCNRKKTSKEVALCSICGKTFCRITCIKKKFHPSGKRKEVCENCNDD